MVGAGRLKATGKQTTAGGRATEQQWQHSDHVLDVIISNVMGEFASTEKVARGAFVLPLHKRSTWGGLLRARSQNKENSSIGTINRSVTKPNANVN